MRIILIGANGQLGSDVGEVARDRGIAVTPLTHAQIEIADTCSIDRAFEGLTADVVINTAAYHRVDEMEDALPKAMSVNAEGTRNLALACRARTWPLMHLSTDYVFSGRLGRPHSEDDPTDPLSAYGISKRAGECLLAACWHQHYIVRSSGLYGVAGSSGKGGNFVETMLRLAREKGKVRVVDDQVLTPTFTRDLAEAILTLAASRQYGLYHCTNAGECSWFEFARTIFELAGLSPRLERQTTAESGSKAARPTYSVLDNRRLRALGMDHMRHWREALKEYLHRKAGRG